MCSSNSIQIKQDGISKGIENKDDWIICQVTNITLPFPSSIAFDTFCDLPRQPEWSPWLSAVEYIDSNNNLQSEGVGRRTKWYLRGPGIRLSWNALSTCLERPCKIGWKSTSGVRNEGYVTFMGENDHECKMSLEMRFVSPRIVQRLFSSRTGKIKRFVENKMLSGTLTRFSNVVQRDIQNDTK